MFINTDSTLVLIFVGVAASSQPLAAVYFGLSVYASKLGLQKLKASLSQRTISLQRNFLHSLYIQTAVHVIFISIPLGIFFLSFIIWIPSSAMCKLKRNIYFKQLEYFRYELYPHCNVHSTWILINVSTDDIQ